MPTRVWGFSCPTKRKAKNSFRGSCQQHGKLQLKKQLLSQYDRQREKMNEAQVIFRKDIHLQDYIQNYWENYKCWKSKAKFCLALNQNLESNKIGKIHEKTSNTSERPHCEVCQCTIDSTASCSNSPGWNSCHWYINQEEKHWWHWRTDLHFLPQNEKISVCI